MSNRFSSLGPSGTNFAPPNKFGGRVQVQRELALPLNSGTWFIIEGSGSVYRITTSNLSAPIALNIRAAVRFRNSSKLILPNGTDLRAYAGDTVHFVHEGDGIWRCTGYTSAGSGKPIVILSTGQSNGSTAVAYTWSPAPNAFVWDWDGVDAHVGANFVPLASTTINPFQKTVSDIAYANPGRPVYLINISYTGLAIAQWLSGASGVAMYTNIQNNVVPALADLGVTAIDMLLYWQGESDTGFPARWRSSFATLTAQFKSETWFPVTTPMVLFAIASNLSSGFAVWDRDALNAAIEGAVRDEPDVRTLVNPNQIGAANYSDGLHPTAAGYNMVGTMAANCILRGFGRKPSVVVHPASISAAAESNIIINGDHEISEENLSTAVTGITSTTSYVTDQWAIAANGAVVVSGVQTTTGLFDTPKCLRTTVTTVDSSIAAGDYLYVYTPIEGTRLRKLGLGGTLAKNSTLGLRVRSSITGTFGVSVLNVAGTRCWVETITISAANTWEWKSICIPPDVSGAWVTDATLAAVVRICLSAGSTYQGTAGAWATSNIMTTSAQTNFSGTNGATFDITDAHWLPGADLIESEHAPLIMLPRQRSLQLCQRYLYVWRSTGAYFGQAGGCASTTQAIIPVTFPASEMRIAPSSFSTPDATKFSVLDMAGGSQACVTLASTGVMGAQSAALLATVASGLTVGRATVMFANGSTAIAKWKSQM
jgi:lysophospholipase L1-like esterase